MIFFFVLFFSFCFALLYFPSQILVVLLLLLFFFLIKVCGNPKLNSSIGTIFPTSAHFVSLSHILIFFFFINVQLATYNAREGLCCDEHRVLYALLILCLLPGCQDLLRKNKTYKFIGCCYLENSLCLGSIFLFSAAFITNNCCSL